MTKLCQRTRPLQKKIEPAEVPRLRISWLLMGNSQAVLCWQKPTVAIDRFAMELRLRLIVEPEMDDGLATHFI
ncbi:MAG: hypothetical protein QGG39_12090 [Candidatus Poribacteria bacterium]|nr:hypothetical protein [Candidatus Poribacteria bacterium]